MGDKIFTLIKQLQWSVPLPDEALKKRSEEPNVNTWSSCNLEQF